MTYPIISVAPMMEWTDRHFRYFARQLTKKTLLYTEMVTSKAILFGNKAKLLQYHPQEQPLAIQLGGSDPQELARCAKIAEEAGFIEVNLNVGCPSSRVKEGRFGACLMSEPKLVAECIDAMRQQVSIPVTVKTRIGIDEQDSYEHLHDFIDIVAAAGCFTFIIHARKAWLNGLSPKENREIPPLRYEVARQVKQDFPHLKIILNGGLLNLDMVDAQLPYFDGAMLGRAAYHDPYLLAEVDQRYYGELKPSPCRLEVIENLKPYIAYELEQGNKLHHITKHLLGLFHGQPGGKCWRRYLSQHSYAPDASLATLEQAVVSMNNFN